MKRIESIINKILENRVLTHVLYWMASVLLWAIVGNFGKPNSIEPLVNKLCYLPSQLLATYLLIYYQLPKLAFKKKYVAFLLSLVASTYVTSVIARFFKVYVYETILINDQAKDPILDILTDIPPLLFQYLLWVYLFPFFTVLVKLTKDHFDQKQKMERLKKDKANAELGFLKAQLHPHFLFNTLNNLYTLTLYKSDKAPDIVLKLAQILDYTLHQDKNKGIAIEKEVELIQNYIDLELLRYGDRLDFVFSKNIPNQAATIAPLVLLSIVENAFKHGASGDHGRPKIHIDLKVQKDHLAFEVFNSKPRIAQADKTNFKKGIGMNNVKRQLDLIYPNQHTFDVEETPDTYKVILEINLQPNLILN